MYFLSKIFLNPDTKPGTKIPQVFVRIAQFVYKGFLERYARSIAFKTRLSQDKGGPQSKASNIVWSNEENSIKIGL